MRYVDEFRDRKLIDKLAAEIREAANSGKYYRFMEVCGTHTMNIFRFGLRELLPENIELLSGPGCPVCVTPNDFIDKAIKLANKKDVVIATFGDMLKVPGSFSSLEKEKAKGCAVKVVYSSIDALDIARRDKKREVVFLGIGFETTAPTVAQSIIMAKKEGIKNYSVLCGHKTMPQVLKALVKDKEIAVDGFLLPGHVSAITGADIYGFLAKEYNKRCVIAGFEPVDILQAILMLLRQRSAEVQIQYDRIVERCGNRLAERAIEKVFLPVTSIWRGIGIVKASGLGIRKEFASFDAEKRFDVKTAAAKENKNCMCGDVLKGMKTPLDCKLFSKICTPENPVGACMVSSEGTCAAYFKYRGKD